MNDVYVTILTSVSVELLAFATKTNKLTDEDVNNLERSIVERLNRKLLDCELDDFIDWKLQAIIGDTKKQGHE